MQDFEDGHFYHPQHDFAYLVDQWEPTLDRLLDDDGALIVFDLNLNTFNEDFPMQETPLQAQHAFIVVTHTSTSCSYANALRDSEPNVEPPHDSLLTLDGHPPSDASIGPPLLDLGEELATAQQMVQALLARGVPKEQILYAGTYSHQQRGGIDDDDSDDDFHNENKSDESVDRHSDGEQGLEQQEQKDEEEEVKRRNPTAMAQVQ
jgi:hypothetical protein